MNGNNECTYEPKEVITAWGLDSTKGLVVNYIYKSNKTGTDLKTQVEDLNKAIKYLQQEIDALEDLIKQIEEVEMLVKPNNRVTVKDKEIVRSYSRAEVRR